MNSGYCITAHCEGESPESTIYDVLDELLQEQRATQRALALLQKTVTDQGKKLDEVLKEKKRPKVEVGYR